MFEDNKKIWIISCIIWIIVCCLLTLYFTRNMTLEEITYLLEIATWFMAGVAVVCCIFLIFDLFNNKKK